MFTADAPVYDTTANTVPDANLQTMFPEQFTPEPIAAVAADYMTDPRTWMWLGGALVLWWAMRRPGRR
jgi:hypothetical protein